MGGRGGRGAETEGATGPENCAQGALSRMSRSLRETSIFRAISSGVIPAAWKRRMTSFMDSPTSMRWPVQVVEPDHPLAPGMFHHPAQGLQVGIGPQLLEEPSRSSVSKASSMLLGWG